MIYRWVNKFRTHGTVHNLNRKDTNRQSHSGRPKSSRTPHNVAAVRDSVVHSPSKSVRLRSQEVGINRESVRIILIGNWSTERDGQGPPVVPAGWCLPHSSNESLAWLQQRFPDRLISRKCDPQWSPHSPDLNPPDFYMWGYLKDRVCGNNPQTIPDLKAAITATIRGIPREECGRAIENFALRIQMCLWRRGAHLEHIFWALVKQKVFVVQT